jgi:tRNA threonylcarbamoyladenosine biosynthesis protein TsaE
MSDPENDDRRDGPWSLTRSLKDETETMALGAALAARLGPGLVIYLSGELGAGKTTFARGVLRGLGYQGRVKSPTYALVELYTISRLYLYHFDFYRLENPREWIDAGLREYFGGDAVCLVEWPEKTRGTLPPADLIVKLHVRDAIQRDVEISAFSRAGRQCLVGLEG